MVQIRFNDHRGCKSPQAKLSVDDLEEILFSKESSSVLAVKFDISASQIRKVRTRATYRAEISEILKKRGKTIENGKIVDVSSIVVD